MSICSTTIFSGFLTLLIQKFQKDFRTKLRLSLYFPFLDFPLFILFSEKKKYLLTQKLSAVRTFCRIAEEVNNKGARMILSLNSLVCKSSVMRAFLSKCLWRGSCLVTIREAALISSRDDLTSLLH